MMKKVVLAVLLLCLGGNAFAVEITVDSDVWIREVAVDTTYNGDGVTIWSTSKGDRRYGILEFDVSSLAGTTVTEAHLDFYSAVHGWSDYGSPILQTAYVIDSGGTAAGSLTWKSYWAEKDAGKLALESLGAYDLPAANVDPAQQDQFVLSTASAADLALIQADVDGDGLLTLAFIADESGAYGQTWGDAELLGQDAVLWVNEVPEPATMALLSLGGLALIRRRRS